MDENNILNQKNQIQTKIKELSTAQDSSQNDFAKLNNNLKDNKKSMQAKLREIENLKNEIQNLESEIEALEKKLNKKKNELNNLEPRLKELELNAARISEKRNNAQEQVLEKEKIVTAKTKEIRAKQAEIETINNDLEKIAKRKLKLKEKQNDLEQAAEKLEISKKNLTKKVKELEKEVEIKEKQAKKLQDKLNQTKDTFHQLDLKYNKLDDQLENIKSILMTDYSLKPAEINLDSLMEIKDENEAEVEKEIKDLKKKIKKLHPVNESAVEEFAKLTERLDYLKEQQTDLNQARNSIELVISDIEESMKKMFANTFYQVKEEFAKVFKALFQGGKAQLKLTDSENMLTTGVEIQAQPPGKSLKSLSLLSGGERALTAIALIFAFIQVKPSPFYVLDEIDAPLDDVNIVRFASFIKKYAKVAQFIIITHRRYMMTEVDSLYGVTMEKSGVSSLVSLKLDQAESFNDNYIKEAL